MLFLGGWGYPPEIFYRYPKKAIFEKSFFLNPSFFGSYLKFLGGLIVLGAHLLLPPPCIPHVVPYFPSNILQNMGPRVVNIKWHHRPFKRPQDPQVPTSLATVEAELAFFKVILWSEVPSTFWTVKSVKSVNSRFGSIGWEYVSIHFPLNVAIFHLM